MIAANQIQSLRNMAEPVLSVFLNTENPDPSHHPRVPAGMTWLRRNQAALQSGLTPHAAQELKEACDRVEQFLEGRHPHEKAIAIFAGRKSWTALSFDTAVEQQIQWGRPAVGQLVRLLGQFSRFVVVAVDHKTTRFFEFYAGEFTSLDENWSEADESQWVRTDVGQIAMETMHKGHGPDHDLYDHRLDAQYDKLWRETANRAAAFVQHHHFAGIFLVGPERLVSAIHNHLPPGVPAIKVFEDLGHFSPKDIFRRIEPLVAEQERRTQLAQVRDLLAAGAGSVVDTDEALVQLQIGTLGTLFVSDNHELHLRECAACLTVSREGGACCGNCGGQLRSVSVLDALPRLAAAHRTELKFVAGEARDLLTNGGGLAGRLRQHRKNPMGRTALAI